MCLRGRIQVVPDKSISHRAVILSAIAEGESFIKNLSPSVDVKRTLNAIKLLGANVKKYKDGLKIRGGFIREPEKPIYCGNSGTTTRLMMGALSGYSLFGVFYGDNSLSKRPMKRVTDPLRLMGARITGREDASLLPIAISGGNLKGIKYELPVASAQVKSAILLAGLNADGVTTVIEPLKTRDHTERMLSNMGAHIEVSQNTISIKKSRLTACEFEVPGDFSAAAFLITLGVLHPDADFIIENVNLNVTRTGFLKILESMGCHIDVSIWEKDPEPVGEIHVKSCRDLKGTVVSGEIVPSAIDELPLLAILGIFAEGVTILRDARELRFKESDRISSIVVELRKLGVKIQELDDGFVVENSKITGNAVLNSHGDHRIAMALEVLRQVSGADFKIVGTEWVRISFPDFYMKLEELRKC